MRPSPSRPLSSPPPAELLSVLLLPARETGGAGSQLALFLAERELGKTDLEITCDFFENLDRPLRFSI